MTITFYGCNSWYRHEDNFCMDLNGAFVNFQNIDEIQVFQKVKISIYFLTCTIWCALSARSTVGCIRTDVYELSNLEDF